MPNWVKTIVKTKPDVLKQIRNKYFTEGKLDFNKIIPIPEDLNITAGSQGEEGLIILFNNTDDYQEKGKINAVFKSLNIFHRNIYEDSRFLRVINEYKNDDAKEKFKDSIELGKKYYDNYYKYGSANWYEWCITNWGTKWNCNDFKSNEDTMIYYTAWDFSDAIILKMSEEYPDAVFECRFANEDFGSLCGVVEIKNEEKFLENYDISDDEKSDIWNTEIEDLNQANELDLEEDMEK